MLIIRCTLGIWIVIIDIIKLLNKKIIITVIILRQENNSVLSVTRLITIII